MGEIVSSPYWGLGTVTLGDPLLPPGPSQSPRADSSAGQRSPQCTLGAGAGPAPTMPGHAQATPHRPSHAQATPHPAQPRPGPHPVAAAEPVCGG